MLQEKGAGRGPLKVINGGRDRLLSVGEVASHLRVCTATVYALVDRGELPHVRVSNAIRVVPSDLAAYIVAQTRGVGRR